MNSKSTQPDRSFNRAPLCYSIVFATLTCLGCADADPLSRVPVTGSVTLDGQPISTVTVVLEPTESNEGHCTRAEVVDGKFELPEWNGPSAGAYMVSLAPAEPEVEQALAAGRQGAQKALSTYKQLCRAIRRRGRIDVQFLNGVDNVVIVELTSR